MEIIIKATSIVRPAQDTPKKRLWSSNLDLLVPLQHFQTVYIYKPDGSPNCFEPQVLKEGLSKVLVPFYPVAGRLGKDESGRIEVQCNAEGVLFIEAETRCVTDDLGDFSDGSKMLPLVPKIDYSRDMSSYPLLLLQATSFKCGGVCLGVGLHHTLLDGTSAIHFINSWANVVRGLPIDSPFIDRTLIKARLPPIPAYQHIEFNQPPSMNNITTDLESQSTPKPPIGKIVTKVFKITLDQINTLKNKSKKEDNTIKYYTTYETLTAHIWRCVCKARGLSNDQATKLHMPIDGRSRLCPPLPPRYFGNLLFTATVTSLSGEVQSEPLVQTIERIHEAVKRTDDEYLRSALDFLKLHDSELTLLQRGAHTFKCPNLNIVSWMRLPIYDADFGWGRPIYMGPPTVPFEGMAFLRPTADNEGSLALAICLEAYHMQLFQSYLYDF